jgi:phage-related minor tail protein
MALNVGNLVATLGLDKKGFDTGIQDAAKKTEGFAGGFSDKLSSLSPTLATMGEKVKGATSGIASKLSSLSPTLAAVGDKFKGVTAGISSGLSSLAAPIGAAKDKLIGLATGFASKMKTLAVPIAAVGAAIASLGTAAVLAADNINKAYNAIRVGSGATGEDLEALKSDFDAVFGTIPAGAGEVGTAIADLNTRLGLTGKPLQNMATRFLELSRITGTDVASNIKEVTRLFGNWSVAAEEQTGMLDYLFKVSQSTGIGVDRLSTLTTQYGSTLRGLGFDLKGSVAVLGKFEKGGVNIEAALAGMKMGLGNLAGKGITDPVEALDELARQVREAGTEIEAVSIAAEVFGARGAAEMAAAIRSGNLDLGDFVTMLDASEETVLTAADASMSLGDRMAILQHKAEKALEPVGNLLIGVFETAMPHLEAAGDALVEAGESVATWAEEAVAAAGPVVDALQEKMTPAVEFFQGRMDHVVTWWDENSKIFIAAWENIAAAISWVIDTVIVPIIEWAWPYIETIVSGVLDMLLAKTKLFAALLAGDWEAAGDALTEISKGAMQALVGVISMGWDAIATGIEWVGQGILGFVYGLWKNIVQWTEDSLNKMIDLINGFIESANRVTEKVGISLPKLGRIHLQADKIEIPKLKIQRWSETSFSKEIDEFLKKDEEEEEEEEEDIDKEFEDEPEREPAPALPKSQLPVAPKPEIPATPPAATIPPVENPEISVDVPEIPETETPTIPAPSVSVPALDTPVPVSVTNWDQMVARIPVQEPGEPAAGREVEVIPVDIPEVSESEIPVVEPPAVVTPAPELPDLPDLPESEIPPIPPTSVEIPETEPPTIPDLPEPGVPESSPAPTPAFSLPIPVTVINWPDALRPVQAAPPATEEQAEPVEEEEDIDKEFEKELEPEPTLSPPKFGLPVAPKPEIPAVPPAATIPPVIVPKPPAPKIPAPIVDVPGLPDFPELPESEAPVVEPPPVDIPVPEIEPPTPVELPVPDLPNSPKLPENGIPLIELPPAEVLEIVPVSAEVPGPDAPAPVTVENWERMPVSPALPAQEIPEILEPVDSKTPIVIPPPPVEIPAPKIIPPAASIPPAPRYGDQLARRLAPGASSTAGDR